MKNVIEPIDKDILQSELKKATFVRHTNKANNDIYIFDYHSCPNLMREVGRLREISFRNNNGGTGLECDIDKYDIAKTPYKQLIVWNPRIKEIIGGYRFIEGDRLEYNKENYPLLATSHLLNFSKKFIKEYLPKTIELGRSFVQPQFQAKELGGLFALDNLWDGLSCLIIDYPNMEYLFGKVTMYTTFDRLGRDYVLRFLEKHFPDKENIINPFVPLVPKLSIDDFNKIFNKKNYKEDHKILLKELKKRGENIPPLINSYMNLSSTMMTFGTSINDEFGGVEETGVMIIIKDIYKHRLERHLKGYKDEQRPNWLKE